MGALFGQLDMPLVNAADGLLARGASPVRAAAWAVAAHAACARRLEQRIGELGYLARELVDEIAHALAALQAHRQ